MKTTVNIADALLQEARTVAAAEGTTLRDLIEQGLRVSLESRRGRRPGFCLRDASFRGNGLQPGIKEGSWETIRDLIYQGRGA
ncbi:MAG: DUF2191 domain-containing protein [Chloroflexota bacterium]|nr:MAG: DUF2191 domain-containing protein [Chloroflexota bacterium]